MSLPASCAPSSTITRRSANSDGLTSSASSGGVQVGHPDPGQLGGRVGELGGVESGPDGALDQQFLLAEDELECGRWSRLAASRTRAILARSPEIRWTAHWPERAATVPYRGRRHN